MLSFSCYYFLNTYYQGDIKKKKKSSFVFSIFLKMKKNFLNISFVSVQ